MLSNPVYDPFQILTKVYSDGAFVKQAIADTYIEEQLGNANLLLGQALIEGLGDEYDPAKGFRMIKRAAIRHGSKDAAAYLAANYERALAYGVDPRKIGKLGGAHDAD